MDFLSTKCPMGKNDLCFFKSQNYLKIGVERNLLYGLDISTKHRGICQWQDSGPFSLKFKKTNKKTLKRNTKRKIEKNIKALKSVSNWQIQNHKWHFKKIIIKIIIWIVSVSIKICDKFTAISLAIFLAWCLYSVS